LKKRELTEAIDRYYASHNRQEKPRAFAQGQTTPAANRPIQILAKTNLYPRFKWSMDQKWCPKNPCI